MNEINQLLGKIKESLHEVLPSNLGDDIKSNISAVVTSAVKELDLVSREELEVQMDVLARTREKLINLEEKLTDLESKIEK